VATALELDQVSVRIDGRTVLSDLSWAVEDGQRWVVLGPNGSGKTTLLRVASLYLHPTAGSVRVLGQTVGRLDVRALRPRIGLASAALANQVRPQVSARDAVMTARFGALEAWWHVYDDADRARAEALLDRFGVGGHADQAFGTLSSGERQRVQLARTLMTDPDLVLLDEPTAGLDLGGREDLLGRLAGLARDPSTPPLVLVTHHVDEIPEGFTHALVLAAGRVVALGPIQEVITGSVLGDAFGLDLEVEHRGGRWTARARRPTGQRSPPLAVDLE
jgi:iron complex transport system ATP-binding protein